MQNYLVLETSQSECVEGYGVILFSVTEHNQKELDRLKNVISEVKKLEPSISSVTIYDLNFDVSLTNDEVELDENKIIQLSDEEYEVAMENEEDFRLDSPFMRVGNDGVTIIYPAKHSGDEVWGYVNFDDLSK